MEEKEMKRIDILKYRKISMLASSLFILLGLVAMLVFGGFNLGIDFGSGYSERVQIAPVGMYVSYEGEDSAVLSVNSNSLELQLKSAEGVSSFSYPASSYPEVESLAAQMEKDGLSVEVVDGALRTENLVSGFGYPYSLGESVRAINFATSGKDVDIEDMRQALSGVGNAKVQTLGSSYEGVFQVRLNVGEDDTQESLEREVNNALKATFGDDNVVVMQTDFVGPKFSADLLRASLIAVLIALVCILIYVAVRFRMSYAISSIVALFHDVLAMISLILIFRLEVSSTTIAAILTIIGYSLNNTIVIFDRVRENVKKEKDGDVDQIITASVNQSLTRTVITSITTLFAIVPLAVFSSGDIKLFAINLTWGILVGAYSSNFIAPAMLSILNKRFPINVFKTEEEEDPLLVD